MNYTTEEQRVRDAAFRKADRTNAVREVTRVANEEFGDLHQTHKAEAWREIGALAKERAQRIEEYNEFNGVPD